MAAGAAAAERARIKSTGDFQFNSGYGSVATAYGCRAWVNFDGTGTPAIRASGNVSSITDIGTGDYYVNYSTSMPDANYCVVATTETIGGTAYVASMNESTLSVSSIRITIRPSSDREQNSVAVFR
jgi:hypothetical protein